MAWRITNPESRRLPQAQPAAGAAANAPDGATVLRMMAVRRTAPRVAVRRDRPLRRRIHVTGNER